MAMLAARRHRRLLHRPDPRDVEAIPDGVDLSGIGLPVSPPPQVVRAAQRAVAELHISQEAAADELRERLAHRLRVDRDRLVLGAGTDLLLRDLLDVMCDPDAHGGPRGNEVVYATPCPDSYLRVVEAVHATPVPVPLAQGRQDLTALAAAIDRDRCRAVLVSNPHYPTGGLVVGGELEGFLDRVPAHVLVVLDETYRDYALYQSTVIDIPDGLHLDAGHPEREGTRPNMVVVRGWDTHGLAALPIGYLAADLDVAAAVAKTAVAPIPSRVAQAAALATLDDAVQDQYRAIWEAVSRTRSWLCGELRGLGFDVPDSRANVVWLPLGEWAEDFARHCARHRVQVRAYPRQGVRVAVGLPGHVDLFLAAASSYRDSAGHVVIRHESGDTAPHVGAGTDTENGAGIGAQVGGGSGVRVRAPVAGAWPGCGS